VVRVCQIGERCLTFSAIGNGYHLIVLHHVDEWQVVHMFQGKIQIACLSGSVQILRALAAQASILGGRAPALDDLRGSGIFRFVTCRNQLPRNPGAANLIFLPKLTPSSAPINATLA